MSMKTGIKLLGGISSGDMAIFAGLYSTANVPQFQTAFAIGGVRIIVGGASAGPNLVQQTTTSINVASVAGTTVRLAILNVMQSTSSGTGPFIPGAGAVVGIGDVQLNVTVAAAPGAPTIGTATGGNGQASVAFTAPASNGGSAITGYTVTSSPGGLTASGLVSPIVINGLTNGTPYIFTVTATNAIGTSAASAASNSVTPATVPGAPTIGAATAGNAQATVAFTAPASTGGSAITGYTVTSSPGGFTATGAASPLTIAGLANGTAYTFTVTATNAAGVGAASGASNSVTPGMVPGAPVIGTATAGNTQATVTFTAPASNGGSAISGYTVTSTPGGFTATGGASSLTVTGLTNGTAYTFTVVARNVVGTGPVSAASNSVTPAAVPGAPLIGAATAGDAQATVTFTAPASNGGSAITGYTVTSSPGGFTATGSASPLTVTGLANGTAYTFTVVARNAVGTGPASAASNGITPLPPAVRTFTGPTATGSGTATVSFTGGGPSCGFAPTGNGPMQSAYFIPLTGHPKSPPAGSAPAQVSFPHGLLDFVLVGCAPGSTVAFTVMYPAPLGTSANYWKYGPTPASAAASWYVLPALVGGNTITFSITDGALGDDDLAANGTVVDQGGPGVGAGAAAEVPTLSEWMMLLLSGLLMMAGMGFLRKNAGR
jgi:hypothetical protein